MRKFFVSLAYVPDVDGEEPEVINGIKIRRSKNHYLYVPVSEHNILSKEEFKDKMSKLAEEMWEHIDKYI